MKNVLAIVLSVFLIFGFATTSSAEGKIPFNGEVTVGGAGSDTSKTGMFSEYSSTSGKSGNLILGGKISYPNEKVRINMYGTYEDGDTQAYGGNVDLNRILQIETDYVRFMHRLGHDNLDHMVATLGKSAQGATLYHTDLNPGDDYTITRSTWKNHAKLNIPSIPGLVLSFNNTWDQRKGMEQARTMSKCASCHVVGKSKDINEVTQVFNPGISYRFGIFDIEYQFAYQTFDAKGDDPTNQYMRVRHPGKVPAGNLDFGQRVQFDNGEFDFSRTPDSEKYSHKVKAKATMDNSSVNLGSVYSKATNNSSDSGGSAINGDVDEELSVDFYAINGGWHWKLNKTMALTVKGKYQKQDGDEVFVDVNDQILVSGSDAGQTYAESLGLGGPGTYDFSGTTLNDIKPYLTTEQYNWAYGFINDTFNPGGFDHERASSYDKEKYIGDVKFAWRLTKKIKLKLGYNIEYENRDNAAHLHLVDDTTTHELSIGSKFKPLRGLRVNANYKYTYVDSPYVFKHALCPEMADDYVKGTYSHNSWYSKYVYGMRTQSSTNRPGQIHEAKVKTYWSPINNLSTNAYARYKYAVNGDADLNDWEQHMFNGGIGGMYAINSKAEISFGYNFFYDKYDATFCSAYYHG